MIIAMHDSPSSRQPTNALRPPRRSIIPDSDDIDWDDDSLTAKEGNTTPAQQIMRKVVIPMNGRLSVDSSLSSARDQSSDYDTPATSAAATPAESLVKVSTSLMSTGRSGKPAKGKRKRSQVDEMVEADALLAQSLQEQEYDEEPPAGKRSKRAGKALVEDSDDEVSLLSDAPMERSVDVDDSEATDAPQRRRRKTTPRTSLPSRAARDCAKKSMTDNLSHQIVDSEDSDLSDNESDESVFLSDLDFDVFDDTEAEEEVLNVVGTSNDATGLNAAIAPANAIPARRRLGGAPSARVRLSRRARQMQGLVDRVRYCSGSALDLW